MEYLAPAVVNVIGVGLGPIITVVAGLVLRRDAVKVIAAEVVAAGGVCVVLGALVWLSFVGRSGLPDISAAGHAAAGLVLTIICAVGSSLNIIYMKRLGEVGCSRGDVLASRFVLMTVLAWLLTAASHRGGVPAAVVPGIVVAVIGVGLPIYVLQLGIHYTEPITTSSAISLSPLFAFLLQLGDSRLSFSPSTLGGILIVLLLVSIGALVRHRQDLALVASSAPSRRHHSDHDSVRRGSEVTICAVVDAYGAGELLPSALRRARVDSVHVRSSNPDRRLSYRAEDFTIDIQQAGDVAATGAALRAVGVDAIVAAAESGVTLADQLNQELGLAGNLIDRTSARRDKYAMQAAVQAAGLPIAGSIEVATSDAAVEAAARLGGWPVVLKPVRSAGSDNVTVCSTSAEVATAFERIHSAEDRYGGSNDTVLVQQFLAGVEHYVNTVSRHGEHRIVEVWRYRKRQVDGHVVYDYDDLLSLEEDGAREVARYGLEVLDALGIVNGAAHTEIMLTPDGPRLIECGARLGGGQVPQLLRRCVGSDQVDTLALSIAEPISFAAQAHEPYERNSCRSCGA